MKIVCLDLEGILVPEIWIAFSEATGIPELRITTRDEPDYDLLMKRRIRILKEHNLKLRDIQEVIGGMEPMEGAKELLDDLRERTQVLILSDTFDQFASPLMKKLGRPTLFCNTLVVGEDGTVESYRLRQINGKCRAVEALVSIGFHPVAVGDSYNDVTMLKAADAGILFRPPANIVEEFPGFPVTRSYGELMRQISLFLAGG
jgi:phosphoserine/homoserine phosphotransferase